MTTTPSSSDPGSREQMGTLRRDVFTSSEDRELIDDTAVIVCCGSGGVGKTTTAAVIGIEAARRGRRAVVVTIDPARRLADALGLTGGLAADPQRIELPSASGELWAMMLDPAATYDGIVRREARDEAQVERILANTFYRNIASALSGTQEYMAGEMLHALHADERFDLVVVDTPPSRNALDFVEAPGVLARFLDHRVFRLLMLPTRGGLRVVGAATQPIVKAIGRVVGSDVLADSIEFFQAFAGMEDGFRRRAREVSALIHAPETAFVVVASPHVDTIDEAVWFARQLGELGFGVQAAIVNRAHPIFGTGTASDARAAADAATDPVLAALWRNVHELRLLHEAEQVTIAPLVEAAHPAPVSVLPLLDNDVHDLVGLGEIADHLVADDGTPPSTSTP